MPALILPFDKLGVYSGVFVYTFALVLISLTSLTTQYFVYLCIFSFPFADIIYYHIAKGLIFKAIAISLYFSAPVRSIILFAITNFLYKVKLARVNYKRILTKLKSSSTGCIRNNWWSLIYEYL